MNNDYDKQYSEIVKDMAPPMYRTPEEQGNSIKKCSILKPIKEIEYSFYSKKTHKE